MGKNKTVKHDRSPDVAPNILIALVHDAVTACRTRLAARFWPGRLLQA